VRAVAFSPDGKSLATVDGYGAVHVFDLASGKEAWRQQLGSSESAVFAPDGKALVGDDRKLVRRWDVATRKELAPFQGHTASIFRVDFSPDGKAYASCATDGTVRVWGGDGKERLRLKLPRKYGLTVAFAPDGKRLACGTFPGENDERVWSLAFSPDDATLAT